MFCSGMPWIYKEVLHTLCLNKVLTFFSGTGKTTFIRLLAGRLKPDNGGERSLLLFVAAICIFKKPQIQPVLFQEKSRSSTSATNLKRSAPSSKYEAVWFYITEYPGLCRYLTLPVCGCVSSQGSVRALLHEKIRDTYTHPQFVTDVMKPMQIDSIIDQDVSVEVLKLSWSCGFLLQLLHWYSLQVQNLSGGELQRVALTLCLGKPADVYLIDEPSAYLDSEQRLMAARVIKR